MSGLSLVLDTPDLARHYERASVDRQFVAGKALVERLEVRPGEHVLDVGCGTGLLAAHVATLVGPEGRVVGVDPLTHRIELAKLKEQPNLRFFVGDAYALHELSSQSFDIIYLNAVFHWLPEKRAPLKNFLRLLRKGGWLGLSTGSKNTAHRIHELKAEVLSRAPYNQHVAPEAGRSQRVSKDELHALLVEAGFSVDSITLEPHITHHASAEAAIEHAQASSFGNFLGHLPEELREQARRDILREVEKLRTSSGIEQRGDRLVALAVKE